MKNIGGATSKGWAESAPHGWNRNNFETYYLQLKLIKLSQYRWVIRYLSMPTMYYLAIIVNSVLTFFMLDDLFDVDAYKKLCLNDVHSLKSS